MADGASVAGGHDVVDALHAAVGVPAVCVREVDVREVCFREG
jgi:hypothetical protein